MPNFAIFESARKALANIPIDSIAEKVLDQQDDLMVDLNVAQMNEGIKADGQKIEPAYKPRTITRKMKMGKRYDVVTLNDFGDFQNAVRVKSYTKRKELYSQDKKSEDLQDKYTPEIFGLTDHNINVVRIVMKPLIFVDVKRYLIRNLR